MAVRRSPPSGRGIARITLPCISALLGSISPRVRKVVTGMLACSPSTAACVRHGVSSNGLAAHRQAVKILERGERATNDRMLRAMDA